MRLTNKQAYVLTNIDRVSPLPYKVTVRDPLPRYQLDGRECTSQITGLCVRKLIVKKPDGRLVSLVRTKKTNIALRRRADTLPALQAQAASSDATVAAEAAPRAQPCVTRTDSELQNEAITLLKAALLDPVSFHRDPKAASALVNIPVSRKAARQRARPMSQHRWPVVV